MIRILQDSITYLVIKGTGAQINADSQYNGVSLYAVGSGTTIENVSVINGSDDGIEFFGGTVSAIFLYLENNARIEECYRRMEWYYN